MTSRWKPVLLLLFSAGVSAVWAWHLQFSSPESGEVDFKAIYFGARCVFERQDPYRGADFLKVFQEMDGRFPSDPRQNTLLRQAVPICINLPTSLFLVAPLALLPWGFSYPLWFLLQTGGLTFAAYLIWDIARERAPALLLPCFLLANSESVLASGNLLVAVVSGCAVALWCFEKGRFVWIGICLLAIALVLKPHDAGFFWLYLLLMPGLARRSAMRSLGVSAALGLLSLVWIAPASPHWMQELHSNLALTSAHGGINDPGPESSQAGNIVQIIDLQSVVSYFRDDRAFYDFASYLICGSLLLIWLIATMRARDRGRHGHLAVAVVIPLSLLITYHRVYDTKLLLLTVPAFAVLWAEGGVVKWLAFLINGVTFLLCGDITLSLVLLAESKLHLALTGGFGTLVKVLMERPIPLALLTMAIFYLAVYVRRVGSMTMAPVAPVVS
jgi:hypothetical protein